MGSPGLRVCKAPADPCWPPITTTTRRALGVVNEGRRVRVRPLWGCFQGPPQSDHPGLAFGSPGQAPPPNCWPALTQLGPPTSS